MTARIQLPGTSDDRPRVAVVVASAALGALLGLGAVLLGTASRARQQTPTPMTAQGTAAAAGDRGAAANAAPEPPASAPRDAAAPPARLAEAPAAMAVAGPGVAAAPADRALSTGSVPQPEPAGVPPSRVTQVIAGRVAYVRCEGLSVRSGPYPCPRDRTLEAAVWDLLDTLRTCRGARPTIDERGAELRLEFHGHAVDEARVRAFGPEARLLEASLEPCLLDPLAALQTKLEPTHMVVSFRFQLL